MKVTAKDIEDYYISMAKGGVPHSLVQTGRVRGKKRQGLFYIHQTGKGMEVVSPVQQNLAQAKRNIQQFGIKRKRSASRSHSRKRKVKKRKQVRRRKSGKKTRRKKKKKQVKGKRRKKSKGKRKKRIVKKKLGPDTFSKRR